MQLILTGVTGVAGLAIYRAALADPSITNITLLTRRALPSWAVLPPTAAEKTSVITHTDYLTYPQALADQLAAHDACIWAQGRSSRGMSEEAYTELTYAYPMALLEALKDAGVDEKRERAGASATPFRFVYISGEHPQGMSSLMFSRVKGRTEHDAAAFCNATSHMKAHSIRPAYFYPPEQYPEDAKHQRSASAAWFHTIMSPLMGMFYPAALTPIEDLGLFAVEVAKGRWPDQEMFRNTELKRLVKEMRESHEVVPQSRVEL